LRTTLREFQEYLNLSYESPREFAARIGVAKETIWDWLAGRNQPKAKSLAKLELPLILRTRKLKVKKEKP
jgi:transcriptional regulator with XRE-family HTH domain